MKTQQINQSTPVASSFFAIILLPVYIAAWGRFGLKVPAAVVLSLIAAVFIRFSFHGSAENSTKFPWGFFWLFPLFIPLGMPLWLIPLSLVVSWILAVSCFGGYGRHIFNPLALAIVFILAGYGSSVSLLVSKPFPGAFSAFKVWTSGMNPTQNEIDLFRAKSITFDASLFEAGLEPSLPSLAFPGVLMVLTVFCALYFKGYRLWFIFSIILTVFFTFILRHYEPGLANGNLNVLFAGITPALILLMLADSRNLPDTPLHQMLHAVIFSLMLVVFFCFSRKILYVAFAVPATQIIYPLIFDLVQAAGSSGKTEP
ncbi:MAG: RnfABCDGE type electron transport complex subunit D [Candidatus Rifleibacteriota bacterium]